MPNRRKNEVCIAGINPAFFDITEEWRKFFPHLPGIALTRLLEKGFIACPAAMVKDTVHILSISGGDEGKTVKISYYWAEHVPRGSPGSSYPHAAAAPDFANRYFNELIEPGGWNEVHRILLQDPYDLRVSDNSIWIALRWPFETMENDGSAPFFEQYDRSTVHIFNSWVLASELGCGKRCANYARCSRCGWGLCSFPCPGCGTDFKFPQVYNATIGDCCLKGALPQKTEAQLVKMGHIFTADTNKCREDEKREWQESAKNLRRRTERT